MNLPIRSMVAAVLLACASAGHADSYSGRLDRVEVKADGTRFFVQSEQLNLYATGSYKDALLAGFFRKAAFTIGYTPFPCAGGMSGKCGSVYSVAVEGEGFP